MRSGTGSGVQRRRHRHRLLAVAVSLTTVACHTDSSPTVDPPSGALVPADERFAASYRVERIDDSGNFSWQTNFSPEFDPDIDPDLSVIGFQVDDPGAWAGDVDGYTDAQRAALRAVIDDAVNDGPGGPCETLSTNPHLVSCTYEVDEVDPMPILVRRIGDSTLLALGSGAARDFLDDEFTEAP